MTQLSTPEPVWYYPRQEGHRQCCPKTATAGNALTPTAPSAKLLQGHVHPQQHLTLQGHVHPQQHCSTSPGPSSHCVVSYYFGPRPPKCSHAHPHVCTCGVQTNTHASDRNNALHPHAGAYIINTHTHKHTYVINMSTYNTDPHTVAYTYNTHDHGCVIHTCIYNNIQYIPTHVQNILIQEHVHAICKHMNVHGIHTYIHNHIYIYVHITVHSRPACPLQAVYLHMGSFPSQVH